MGIIIILEFIQQIFTQHLLSPSVYIPGIQRRVTRSVLMGTKAPSIGRRLLVPDRHLPLLHKVVGGLNGTHPGDVGTGKDLIGHQGKSVWIIACGSEDHIERLAKGTCLFSSGDES